MTQMAEGYRPPAGWYPDPSGAPGQRWWDGAAWTGSFQPGGMPGGWAPQGPPRRWSPWVLGGVALVVLALAVGLVLALSGGDPAEPPEVFPTDFGQQYAPSTDQLLSLIGQDSSADAVRQLDQQCGGNLDAMGNLECPTLGFEITFDGSLTATRVILYPFQENSMAEYTGALPGGVVWSDGYPDVVARLGEPAELEGGFGAIDITAHYQLDGYDVGYGLDTWYNSPDDLQNAHLTAITIQPL